MDPAVVAYHERQAPADAAICKRLAHIIGSELPNAESKVWHGHPVWFLDGNPIVGYDKLKDCVRLLFWSGQSFPTPGMQATGSFKASELRYVALEDVDESALRGWLAESRDVQWDYKNIVKRKGRLERLR
ncbi:MAG: DUF1801 domain-containing protein [Thermoplasmatota archaeon]